MQTLIILLLGIAIGYYFAKDKFGPKDESTVDQNEINRQRAEEHQKNLDWIMGHFNNEDEITNDKVERLLGVSDTTVGRYLDELEKSGKLKQVGNTGKYVTYKKI